MVRKRSVEDSSVMPKSENRQCRSTQLSTRDLKKGPKASITSPPPKSQAAKFNARVLKKLQAAVDNNPDINLMTQMPINYTSRLIEFQGEDREESKEISEKSETTKRHNGDIRDCLQASDPVDIVWPLSSAVLGLLEETSHIVEPLPDGLPQRLLNLMQTSEVLWKSPFPERMMVFKSDAGVVVKAVRHVDDDTEYTTLQYLECHKPDIPAPRPLGYVRMSGITLMFQTYKPSTTLATVWPRLDNHQKASIRDQLSSIMSDLRSIPYTYTDGSALGGVAGEGCKDIRRHLRKSEKPIRSLAEFEEFLFSSHHPGGQVFIELIRQLYPAQPTEMKIVFTHGDLRPDNITVDMDDCNQWVATGLLDWEYSGFYPEYCEAFKCTNCLAPYEEDDWYLFLPDCISPKRYPHWWLLDRVREARFV